MAATTNPAVGRRRTSNPGPLFLDGYGISLRVERGALVARDGLGDQRRERRLFRGDRSVNRVVIYSDSGEVSLAAMRWCADVGISVTVIDPNGVRILSASTPATHDDARLRRAQALAGDQHAGFDVAKYLITEKLNGQISNVRDCFGDATAIEFISSYCSQLGSATSIAEVLSIEANAANCYFKAWAGTQVPFARADAAKVPPSWRSFAHRTSILTDGHEPRRATDPINAIANYLYRLAEVEATLACHAMGLDPGLGVLHRDAKGRDSLALDLIEPVRPHVDRYLLDLVGTHTFTRRDFIETRDGQCRLMPAVTEELAQSMPLWAKAVAPVAEAVAHALVDSMPGVGRRRSPLTGKTKTSPRRTKTMPHPAAARLEQRCPDCGGPLGDARRQKCPACFESERLDLARARVAASEALVERLSYADANTGEGKRALGAAKNGLVRYLNTLWELEHPDSVTDPAVYRREVLPLISAVPVPVIRERLRVGNDSAWRIRNGTLTPHARRWAVLRELATS